MERKKLFKILENYIEEPLPENPENLSLGKDLNLDSLDLLELSIWIEDAFFVRFSDSDLPSLKTVGDIVLLIEGRDHG